MRKSRPLTGLALGLAGLLLAGCGSASPGVAAEVGDETITVSEVDRAASHMCTALAEDFRSSGSVVPMGVVRQGVLQLLALDSQARQIAEEYGVTAGETFRREVAQRRDFAQSLPSDVRSDYIAVMTANARANAVLQEAGRVKLEEEGFESPTTEQVSQAGRDIFQSWPDSHGIEANPRYGVALQDGALVPSDTNLSVAVSDQAVKGLANEPDPAYTEALLGSHRCGD